MGWRVASWFFKGLNWLFILMMLSAPFGLWPASENMSAQLWVATASKLWLIALSVFSLFRGLADVKYVIGSLIGYGVVMISAL